MQYGGVLVNCLVYENSVRIAFKQYAPGVAPVLLINYTKSTVINHWQGYLSLHTRS